MACAMLCFLQLEAHLFIYPTAPLKPQHLAGPLWACGQYPRDNRRSPDELDCSHVKRDYETTPDVRKPHLNSPAATGEPKPANNGGKLLVCISCDLHCSSQTSPATTTVW